MSARLNPPAREGHGRPIAGGGLLLLGFLLFRINRDIARRQQLEAELREEVFFREQFIGILGHDLRNPLSAIVMSARRLCTAGAVSEPPLNSSFIFAARSNSRECR